MKQFMTDFEKQIAFNIRKEVLKTYSLQESDLNRKKKRIVSDANCMTFLLVKKHFEKQKTKVTYQSLADLFEMKTHSTIINGIAKIQDLLKYDKKTKYLYNKAQIRILNKIN